MRGGGEVSQKITCTEKRRKNKNNQPIKGSGVHLSAGKWQKNREKDQKGQRSRKERVIPVENLSLKKP